VAALTAVPGVSAAFAGAPRFHEAVVRLPAPAAAVLDALATRGLLGGVALGPWYPELGEAVLVCATETKTDADIAGFADALAAVLAEHAR
jgi:glycine dehydrogenase subunit 1